MDIDDNWSITRFLNHNKCIPSSEHVDMETVTDTQSINITAYKAALSVNVSINLEQEIKNLVKVTHILKLSVDFSEDCLHIFFFNILLVMKMVYIKCESP